MFQTERQMGMIVLKTFLSFSTLLNSEARNAQRHPTTFHLYEPLAN
jgi:hypothetical protein